jgi:hypothetical protein
VLWLDWLCKVGPRERAPSPAARARPERQCQHDRGKAARRTDAE